MIKTIAVNNYRSITDLVLPLGVLNVITGGNGVGKSNLYKSLRLLSRVTCADIIQKLTYEGGNSVYWAGASMSSTNYNSTSNIGFFEEGIKGSALTKRAISGAYTRPFMWIKPTLSRCSCPVKPRGVKKLARLKGAND
jgi:predicted ATPase